MLEITQLPVLNDNYIYLLHEPDAAITGVVDPAVATPVIKALESQHRSLDFILNTHHHSDHVGANLELKALTGCTIIGAEKDQKRIPGIDQKLSHGQCFSFGIENCEIFETPGHTSGHICFYFANSDALFCGDTVFSMGCGRLFEGSAEQMWTSLQLIKSLPETTKIYCAHEYTQANGVFAASIERDNPALEQRIIEVNNLRKDNLPTVPSTLSQELSTNPFLREQCLSIQQALNMENYPAVEVFAELRKRKDHF